MRSAAIYGTGAYTPSKTLSNEDFAKTLDTTDEWITTRTGIKSRRIAAPEEATSDLSLKAAQAALENSGIKAEELDLILIGTITPDFPFPSCACVLQQKLGIAEKNIPAFDLSAACSGFIYAMSTAQAYIGSGMANNVLIVGAEIISRLMDYTDRTTCILFGDGAGAAIIGPERKNSQSHKILSTKLYADGRGANLLMIPAGGSARPITCGLMAAKFSASA
jgi:3-oxoacyl-[acyl-carrier-protein] synthase III